MTEADAIDRQLEDRFRAAAEDNSQRVDVEVGGAHIDNRDKVSTSALLWMLVVSVGIAAIAIGVSIMAEREAQNAEREARVAINKAEELNVQAQVNKTLIEMYIVKWK